MLFHDSIYVSDIFLQIWQPNHIGKENKIIKQRLL